MAHKGKRDLTVRTSPVTSTRVTICRPGCERTYLLGNHNPRGIQRIVDAAVKNKEVMEIDVFSSSIWVHIHGL